MMVLTVPARYLECGAPCLAYNSTPGSDCQFPYAKAGLYQSCEPISSIPRVAKVLVDCCDELKVKALDPDSSLLVLADKDELDDLAPVLDELRARKIIVVKAIERINKLAIKIKLRKSFFDANGVLINRQFTTPGLAPSDMADAWLGFSGNASDDSVRCHYDASHVLSHWQSGDNPMKTHYDRYRCHCFEQPAYNLPALYGEDGRDVTGPIYQVMDRTNTANDCRRGIVVTHRDLPVSKVTLSTLALNIDSLWLHKLDKSLTEKEELGLIDDEYYALCEQLLLVVHFTGVFRKFKRLREEYIDLLNSYKAQLHSLEHIICAERTAASLLVCLVDQEIKAVVSALVGLEKARKPEGKQHKAPAEAFDPDSKNNVTATLAVLAEIYAVNFFRDVILNDLMSAGSLGCLFSDGYFKSEQRDEKLMSLLEKGTDLTGALDGIAKKLQELTEPFLPTSQAKSA